MCQASPPQLNLFMVLGRRDSGVIRFREGKMQMQALIRPTYLCRKAAWPHASYCTMPASCHPSTLVFAALISTLLGRQEKAPAGGTCVVGG